MVEDDSTPRLGLHSVNYVLFLCTISSLRVLPRNENMYDNSHKDDHMLDPSMYMNVFHYCGDHLMPYILIKIVIVEA